MPINFDALPQERPANTNSFLVDPGFYKAKIIDAEIKPATNPENKPFLALTYELYSFPNKPAGKLWDNLFDMEKQLPRWKLARFLKALDINLAGAFELKDVAKIIKGKELIVDVGINEKKDKPKNEVEVFKGDIYYHVSEWASLLGVQHDVGINAPDADDVPFPTDEDETY